MKKVLVSLFLTVLAMTAFEVSAQKPGYTRYAITKNITNGQVSDGAGGAGYWIKFEGNIMWLDMGFGSQSRYVYNSTQGNGNKLYYLTAYNHGGTMGSGWMTFYDSWALVSPDGQTINVMRNNGRDGQVLHMQSAGGAGDMIE